MFKDQIVFNTRSVHVMHVLDHGITFAVSDAKHRTAQEWIKASGKASHWNIALKLLKEEKEHDGDVRNTIMDNTMCNANEKADQKLIKLKTLVEG